MQVLSVNIAAVRDMHIGPRTIQTGIYKLPATTPIQVNSLGLQNDAICNTKDHGGPDQAVYIYGTVDYDWWSAALGRAIDPGTFGENLTVSNLASNPFTIGDRLSIGAIELEVTAPRIPCSTFAQRMGDPQWIKRFREAERPGLYCRVIKQGMVSAGDPVSVIPYGKPGISVVEVFRLYYDSTPQEATLRRALAAPLDIRARDDYEQRLAALKIATE